MTRIVCDSTMDFTLDEIKKYNIDIVPLKIVFKEKTYRDWVELKSEDFYSMLQDKENDYPTTSQPSPIDFSDIFEKYPNEDIICFCLSSKLSGTYQSAMIASKEIKNKITVIDTQQATLAARMIVAEAIKLRDTNVSHEEIVKKSYDMILKMRLYAGFDTLDYLVKGGRLPKVVGVVGGLLKIKPIVTIKDGLIGVFAKPKGIIGMYKNILKIALSDEIDTTKPVYVGYTYDKKVALKLKEILEENGIKVDELLEIGAVIGVHAGPGACAIIYCVK